jgi:hypothetical protein
MFDIGDWNVKACRNERDVVVGGSGTSVRTVCVDGLQVQSQVNWQLVHLENLSRRSGLD